MCVGCVGCTDLTFGSGAIPPSAAMPPHAFTVRCQLVAQKRGETEDASITVSTYGALEWRAVLRIAKGQRTFGNGRATIPEAVDVILDRLGTRIPDGEVKRIRQAAQIWHHSRSIQLPTGEIIHPAAAQAPSPGTDVDRGDDCAGSEKT